MADLKTDYKDDVLDTTQNTKRKYQMINNQDGTVSFEDVTEYLQQGDSFGADDVNAITDAINKNDGVPVGAVVTFDGSQLPSGFEPYTTAEQTAIQQFNDNLAQTPITVGGETLSTIDDKLNYLLTGFSQNLINKCLSDQGTADINYGDFFTSYGHYVQTFFPTKCNNFDCRSNSGGEGEYLFALDVNGIWHNLSFTPSGTTVYNKAITDDIFCLLNCTAAPGSKYLNFKFYQHS